MITQEFINEFKPKSKELFIEELKVKSVSELAR